MHLFTAGRTKREIRGELTARGIQTATGGRWSDGTIQRVLERHGLWTKARPEEERFADRVSVDPESGCHLWTGATSDGRGRFDVEGRNVLAHQHAYLREHGLDSLPAGHDLHHACRNPRCVNPAHLVLVPRDEHMTLESEEERINIAAQDGTLAAELEELAKIDDPAASPPATRVGVLRAKPPARAAA